MGQCRGREGWGGEGRVGEEREGHRRVRSPEQSELKNEYHTQRGPYTYPIEWGETTNI